MVARLTDSPVYAHLWSTPELDAVFGEQQRWQRWLDVLVALARVQARAGIVPGEAAQDIAAAARVEHLDMAFVAERTRATSHSTLGLIQGLHRVLPERAREHVYVGATVQDVTDTWFGLVLRDVGALARRDVAALEERALALAAAHRDTAIAGRTHGQPGAPVTFGFKAASWADELHRHGERLAQGRARWEVGQLAGAVGTLGFHEDRADPLALRAAFCAELGLGDPGMSWTTSRDRVAEFGGVLALVCGTLARIGGEVYELARPEIGELAEPVAGPEAVGSITMPHKRNPEASEHLDTLARLARSSAAVLLEGTVAAHERDGRGWKAEWAALPEACLLAGTALSIARTLLDGLEVHPEAMSANLARHGDRLSSERVLAGLSERLGKHAAQELLQDVLASTGLVSSGPPSAGPGSSGLVDGVVARGVATAAEVRAWAARSPTRTAGAMVDAVVARGVFR